MLTTIRVPALHDRHGHTSLYASFASCVNLAGLDAAASIAALQNLDPARLSVAFGWHGALAPLSDADLAALPPVVIVNVSMHGYCLSPAAMPMLADAQHELVAHRADGAWIERHLPQVLEFFARTAELTPQKLDDFMDGVLRLGIGVVDDMLLPGEAAFDVIRRSRWSAHIRCWATPQAFRTLGASTRLALAGLKFFTDGAIGTRTAALRGTYRDGRRGLMLHTDDQLLQVLGDGHAAGKAIAIHAIGDLAIEQVLTVLERLDRDGVRFPAVRMEHAQFIDAGQARRARDLGVVLSMQPNFNSDSRDYADRLDAAWLAVNNPFRMLIDQVGFTPGQDLLLGSDGMPHGVEYALQWSLFPLYPSQRLTADELIAGYGVDPGGSPDSLVEIDEDRRRVRLLAGGERRDRARPTQGPRINDALMLEAPSMPPDRSQRRPGGSDGDPLTPRRSAGGDRPRAQ